MSKIKIMDEILANKIAAGEVVERCASVVKELVENAIDAGSTEIKVDLIEAGTKQIKVVDNGVGMDHEDAILCFSRHATSKLKTEEDLFRIETLGFRGEALASIASVSKLSLKTSTGGVGTLVLIEGGKIKTVENTDSRRGTEICVSNLFYNTPARLKHMKSLYTELASITDYMNKLALSHPDIKFVLTNNNSTILNTDGSGILLKTISSIYGINVVKKMIEVSSSDNDYDITGFISKPEVQRSSRNHMITLVNGRVVKNATINRVINDSYHSFKPDNRYPIVVLCIEVDPTLVDVNVHPTKMDIKFSKMTELEELVSKMIKKALHNLTLIPHIEVEDDVEDIVINSNLSEENTIRKPVYVEQTLYLERTSVKEENVSYDIDVVKNESKEDNSSLVNSIEEIPYIPLDNNEPEEKKVTFVEDKTTRLPEMYPVGLVHGTYIICQNEEGMYMIDQHAAKERVNYEFFKEKLGNPVKESIPLLFPITIEYSNNEFMVLKKQFDFIRSLNFEIEEFGLNSIIIKSHPTWILEGYEEESIRTILDLIIELKDNFSIEKFNDKAAATMSCKRAIKANENITIEEMEHLISDLRHCDNPFNCPHGRPTTIYYSKYDLEKLFKRSGFDILK